jgi:hypothetical protein
MATRVLLVCDVCGRETTVDEGRFTIAWGANEVEIDLCATHAAEIHALITTSKQTPHHVGASSALSRAKEITARKASKTEVRTPTHTRTTAPDPRAVRAWAENNGYEVNDKGRLSKDLVAKFLESGN